MRLRVPRSAAVAIPVLAASLVGAAGASAHGGATVAQGGSGGVSILLQAAEATTPSGKEAVDLSTVIEGPGTGPKAKVTYWIRPAGKKTFKVQPERDEAGIAHTDVAIGDRGSWRTWDISAIVDLSTGKRLRVSNAEANPPGPEPAATAGGGATGAEKGEAPATTRADGATPTTTTEAGGAAETTTTEGDAGTAAGTSGAAAAEVTDVTGESNGTPGWVIPSAIVVVLAGVAIVLVRRRRAS